MSQSNVVADQRPAIAGWFSWPPSKEPFLIGSRCKKCGDYFFPKVNACQNPKCMSLELEAVPFSRRGKVFTFAINYYKPPPPYVSPDPFVPYASVVVELEKEKMKVQGMIISGYDITKLKVGMEVELVLDLLYIDAQGINVIAWKFKPV